LIVGDEELEAADVSLATVSPEDGYEQYDGAALSDAVERARAASESE